VSTLLRNFSLNQVVDLGKAKVVGDETKKTVNFAAVWSEDK
jgi:hypothetical protein